MENWELLKENIYYRDGSLRDIYIRNTTKEDWKLWSEMVNSTYKITFFSGERNLSTDKIDIYEVYDYWDGKSDLCLTATILIGNIVVKAHFFSEEEIENDITPSDINSHDDHLLLVNYLRAISTALGKKVVLTPENYKASTDMELITVDNGEVIIANFN